MAWTSPKTFISAVLSSAELNTHLRDNLLAILSTTGNLTDLYERAAWAPDRGRPASPVQDRRQFHAGRGRRRRWPPSRRASVQGRTAMGMRSP